MGYSDLPTGKTTTFGSQDITINTVVFVLEEGTLDEPVGWNPQYDAAGAPSREYGVDDVGNGSFTLQCPSGTFTPPAINDRFTAVPIWGGTAINLKVAGRAQAWNNRGFKRLTIPVRKVLNP